MLPGLINYRAAAWLTLLCLALPACSSPEQPGLSIKDAQIRALLPGRDTTAGYFTLTNNTGVDVVLSGAQSPYARAIEMHKTVVRDDRVGMQRVKQLSVQAGSTARFERGGLHLMIFGVTEMPEAFPITLIFSNGEQLDVPFSKLDL